MEVQQNLDLSVSRESFGSAVCYRWSSRTGPTEILTYPDGMLAVRCPTHSWFDRLNVDPLQFFLYVDIDEYARHARLRRLTVDHVATARNVVGAAPHLDPLAVRRLVLDAFKAVNLRGLAQAVLECARKLSLSFDQVSDCVCFDYAPDFRVWWGEFQRFRDQMREVVDAQGD